YGCPLHTRGRVRQIIYKALGVKDVVSEYQRRVVIADKIGTDNEGLSQTFGLRLFGISECNAKSRPVAKEGTIERKIARRGDHENIADFGEHQNRKGVIDHRLVVDEKEWLTNNTRD